MAQRLVQQVQEALVVNKLAEQNVTKSEAEVGLEHLLLGGTPEAALKLQELKDQIEQDHRLAVAHTEQAAAEGRSTLRTCMRQ